MFFDFIGTDFTAPKSLLHINDGALPVNIQLTNDFTGAQSTDGLQVGITADGTAQINQQENSDLNFLTNNIPAASILANGNIQIKILANEENGFVTADNEGTLKIDDLKANDYIKTLEARISAIEEKLTGMERLLAEEE
ncbi:MAG: hypothetical protein KJ607_01815 [Bacteroidetes bacterium]|nr:hypothetical protein [Bacteroidota bacterium]